MLILILLFVDIIKLIFWFVFWRRNGVVVVVLLVFVVFKLLNSCLLIIFVCICWELIVNNGVVIEIGVIFNIILVVMDVLVSKIFFDLFFVCVFWFIFFL